LIGLILLGFLLYPSSVLAQNYCFSTENTDKIIVGLEKGIITEKALNQCNDTILIMTDLVKTHEKNLANAEDLIKKQSEILERQQKMIEDVNTIVEKVRKDEQKKAFWGKITWGTYGTVIGTIIGIVVMSL